MAVASNTSSGLNGVAQLIQLLGGSKGTTTTNAGDTTELQKVIAESQTSPEAENALLASIFQQAAGQIPGLQGAFANATGARSGNNSAVAAALSKLLQQTTTGAQQQIAAQRQQALQTRANAASAIAQATRGTNTTQKGGTNLGQAGAIIAGLQLFGKVKGLLDEEGGIGSALQTAIGGGGTGASTAPVMSNTIQAEQLAPMEAVDTSTTYDPMIDFGDGGTQLNFDDGSLFADTPLELDVNNDDLTGGFSDAPLDFNF